MLKSKELINTNTGAVCNRNTGVDLLRIILMMLVVLTHILSKGGLLEASATFSIQWFVFWFLRALCYTSVTCFFMISSYFLIDKEFNIKRPIYIALEVLFYSFLCFAIRGILVGDCYNISSILNAIFPISRRTYGFINNYILLLFLSPVFNIIIKNISRKVHLLIVAFLLFSCSILPYVFFTDTFNVGYGEGVLWIALIYFIIAFIKMYRRDSKHNNLLNLGAVLLLCLIQLISKTMIAVVTKLMFGEVRFSSAFYGETPLLSLLASLFLFSFFLNLNIKEGHFSKIITSFSRLMLSVYLIHESPFVRDILWDNLNLTKYINSFYIIVAIVITIVSIFLIATIIDFIRYFIFKKTNVAGRLAKILRIIVTKIANWRCFQDE